VLKISSERAGSGISTREKTGDQSSCDDWVRIVVEALHLEMILIVARLAASERGVGMPPMSLSRRDSSREFAGVLPGLHSYSEVAPRFRLGVGGSPPLSPSEQQKRAIPIHRNGP
jgi:hypothetical protein